MPAAFLQAVAYLTYLGPAGNNYLTPSSLLPRASLG